MITAAQFAARVRERFAPPPRLSLSEWADQFRILTAEATAEPGRWRTRRVPYLREPMDVISDRHVDTVVIMASSQTGKTEVLLNLIGRHIHLDPAPMMLIEPTLDMAKAISTDRIAPMIEAMPVLHDRVSPARSRSSSNTVLRKGFPGGHLTLAGSNSPASLASRPIRILLGDEVDRWAASVGRKSKTASGSEGDPLTLAVKRTTTFRRRKIIIVSSPTIKGASRVEDWYEISDKRRLHVPCPRCSERFVIRWSDVRWTDRDTSTAHLVCPNCSGRIEDTERPKMIAAGVWIAEKPFAGVAGFHVWEMYSPWRSLRDQVQAFLVSLTSMEKRQAWTNTALGETWEAPGEKVDASALLLRREAYTATVPTGVQVLTMGVDVQDDRLEALVVGWGEGEESWIVARETWYGDPAQPEVWKDLDEVLEAGWACEDGGQLRIQCTLVDSGGHKTQAVYNGVIPRQRQRVFASKGRSGGISGLLVSPSRPIRPRDGSGTVLLRVIDPDQGKILIFGRLKMDDPGPEYIHFPDSLGEQFFDELTAEKLVTKRNKFGVPTKVWEQVRERNESLDCFVLAHAALRIVAPTPKHFEKLAASQRKA